MNIKILVCPKQTPQILSDIHCWCGILTWVCFRKGLIVDIPKYRSHFHLLFVDASGKVGGKLSYFSSEKKNLVCLVFVGGYTTHDDRDYI